MTIQFIQNIPSYLASKLSWADNKDATLNSSTALLTIIAGGALLGMACVAARKCLYGRARALESNTSQDVLSADVQGGLAAAGNHQISSIANPVTPTVEPSSSEVTEKNLTDLFQAFREHDVAGASFDKSLNEILGNLTDDDLNPEAGQLYELATAYLAAHGKSPLAIERLISKAAGAVRSELAMLAEKITSSYSDNEEILCILEKFNNSGIALFNKLAELKVLNKPYLVAAKDEETKKSPDDPAEPISPQLVTQSSRRTLRLEKYKTLPLQEDSKTVLSPSTDPSSEHRQFVVRHLPVRLPPRMPPLLPQPKPAGSSSIT